MGRVIAAPGAGNATYPKDVDTQSLWRMDSHGIARTANGGRGRKGWLETEWEMWLSGKDWRVAGSQMPANKARHGPEREPGRPSNRMSGPNGHRGTVGGCPRAIT